MDNYDDEQWIKDIRKELITMEWKNIESRVRRWISVVNLRVVQFCQQVRMDNNGSNHNYYSSNNQSHCRRMVKPLLNNGNNNSSNNGNNNNNMMPQMSRDQSWNTSDFLGFIEKWNGIHVLHKHRQPQTYEQYRTRAINWLNGRRPRQYDCTLFPALLQMTDTFVESLNLFDFLNPMTENHNNSNNGYSNNNNVYPANMEKRLRICLKLGLMQDICEAKVSLDTRKGNFVDTNLICKNIIRNNRSRTIIILKGYYFLELEDDGCCTSSDETQQFTTTSFRDIGKAFQEMHDKHMMAICSMISQCNDNSVHDIIPEQTFVTVEELAAVKHQMVQLAKRITVLENRSSYDHSNTTTVQDNVESEEAVVHPHSHPHPQQTLDDMCQRVFSLENTPVEQFNWYQFPDLSDINNMMVSDPPLVFDDQSLAIVPAVNDFLFAFDLPPPPPPVTETSTFDLMSNIPHQIQNQSMANSNTNTNTNHLRSVSINNNNSNISNINVYNNSGSGNNYNNDTVANATSDLFLPSIFNNNTPSDLNYFPSPTPPPTMFANIDFMAMDAIPGGLEFNTTTNGCCCCCSNDNNNNNNNNTYTCMNTHERKH